ncbi:hypothetical protein MYCTH_2125192 [Thermothelomyces thermophilus ATCC 42464]|uniref:Uncharacterized protein n=1 Tax=Thermothelomyces thermophilus (strain ATCC 42464 / BCRC 31852 / DSM 1799) TaxID=573729 RepID=G2Q8I0_THET4|nr:uncharacterized protein MYCTH_2125192 [Thermothelomyces thermophilus ATCC 42464]AEO56229.1 hypothetical protein MYCTH_2125192 [Thermothelomyces thermophilus ATCC 42464]
MPSRTHWHFASNVVPALGEHQLPGAPDAWGERVNVHDERLFGLSPGQAKAMSRPAVPGKTSGLSSCGVLVLHGTARYGPSQHLRLLSSYGIGQGVLLCVENYEESTSQQEKPLDGQALRAPLRVANPHSHSWLKREAAKKCAYIKEQFLQNDTNVNLTWIILNRCHIATIGDERNPS